MVIEPNESYSVNSIIESRDAIFDETRFVSIPRLKDRLVEHNVTPQDVSQNDTNDESIQRSKWTINEKSFGSDFYIFLVEGSRNEIVDSIPYVYNAESDPFTFSEAMKSQDAELWR